MNFKHSGHLLEGEGDLPFILLVFLFSGIIFTLDLLDVGRCLSIVLLLKVIVLVWTWVLKVSF